MAEHPNNVAKNRKKRGLSQQQLAEMIGAHAITISNLERGHAPLTDEWLVKLSDALKVDPYSLLKEERPLKLFIEAELDANRLMFWENAAGLSHDINFAAATTQTVPITADAPRWTLIKSDSFYPVFRHLDVVRLVPLFANDQTELNWAKDRLCIVIRADNEKPNLGYLQFGSKPRQIALDPINGPTVVISWPYRLFVLDRAIYRPNFSEK